MKKTAKRSLIFVMALLITGVMTCSDSFAYFQRGSVGVYAGQSSVSVSQGGSAAVSLSFSPASSSQLPGCGMAECPQICGEKDCLDANGECKCAGTTYMTYYASANAYSSNTSVATGVVQRQHCVYQRYLAGQCDDNGHCVAQAVHEHIDEHIRDGKRQHAGCDTGDNSFVRTGVSKTGKEKQIKEK